MPAPHRTHALIFRVLIILLVTLSTLGMYEVTLKEYEATSEEMRLHDEVLLQRSRRQLLFPNITVLQFNFGLGTPTPIKTINVNWAFQANFMLPWNRTQIPLDILHANGGYTGFARKRKDIHDESEENDADRDGENDAKLHHLYKYVEDTLDGFGHNGTSCVLQTLCHLGAEPLHTDNDEDLIHDLVAYVLNPNHDAEDGQLPVDHESHPYIKAYNQGQTHRNCLSMYQHCSLSLIDMFTTRKTTGEIDD